MSYSILLVRISKNTSDEVEVWCQNFLCALLVHVRLNQVIIFNGPWTVVLKFWTPQIKIKASVLFQPLLCSMLKFSYELHISVLVCIAAQSKSLHQQHKMLCFDQCQVCVWGGGGVIARLCMGLFHDWKVKRWITNGHSQGLDCLHQSLNGSINLAWYILSS